MEPVKDTAADVEEMKAALVQFATDIPEAPACQYHGCDQPATNPDGTCAKHGMSPEQEAQLAELLRRSHTAHAHAHGHDRRGGHKPSTKAQRREKSRRRMAAASRRKQR